MSLLIEDRWLPATLTASPMDDDQFAAFCSEYPDFRIEMSADGELIIKPPNFTLTGMRNNEISGQLRDWARLDGKGKTFDSSTGFVLANGARRSPDCCWASNQLIRAQDPQYLDRYWRLCPEFIVELRSPTDRVPNVRNKMREWIANGAQLAWLIDPERRSIEVFRPNQEPETLLEPTHLAGEGPVAGFTLALTRVWEPLA